MWSEGQDRICFLVLLQQVWSMYLSWLAVTSAYREILGSKSWKVAGNPNLEPHFRHVRNTYYNQYDTDGVFAEW